MRWGKVIKCYIIWIKIHAFTLRELKTSLVETSVRHSTSRYHNNWTMAVKIEFNSIIIQKTEVAFLASNLPLMLLAKYSKLLPRFSKEIALLFIKLKASMGWRASCLNRAEISGEGWISWLEPFFSTIDFLSFCNCSAISGILIWLKEISMYLKIMKR